MWSMPEAGPAMPPTVTTPTPWCQGWTTVSWILERVFPLYPYCFWTMPPFLLVKIKSFCHPGSTCRFCWKASSVSTHLRRYSSCWVKTRAVGSLLLFPRFWIMRNCHICHEWSMIIWFCQCPILPSQICQGYQLGDLHCCGFLYKYAKAAPQQTDMAWGQWPANCGSIA